MSAAKDKLLLAALDRDGAAVRRLRHRVEEVLEWRDCPLHAASIVTDLLTGAGPDGADPNIFDDAWVTKLTHNQVLPEPVPLGVPVEISTRVDALKLVYGQLTGSHLDPDPDDLDPVGALPEQVSSGPRRLIVDLRDAPDGLRLDPCDLTAYQRACANERWFTSDGHLSVTWPDDGSDDLTRYARWLTDPSRSGLRGALPASPDRMAAALQGLVDLLAGYRATFATHGRWVWTRTALQERIDAPLGTGQLRHELELLARQATRLYPDRISGRLVATRRALASELSQAAEGWQADDRRRLTGEVAWLGTLFAATATLTRQFPDVGPTLIAIEGQQVHATEDPRFGLAGVWDLEPLTDAEVEAIRQEYRTRLDAEARRKVDVEVAAQLHFPFTTTLTTAQFASATIRLPDDASERLHPDAPVTIRLAYTPPGRFANRPVAASTTGRPDDTGALPFEWPALLPIGTRLEGTVGRRGKLIELRPA